MKKLNNTVAKKYILLCILMVIVFSIIMGLAVRMQTKKYIDIVNEKISQIIGEIQKQYPEIDEGNIIKILNTIDKGNEGKEILAQYGITDEISTIVEIERTGRVFKLINILILFSCSIILIILFIIYLIQRQKKINELDRYIQRISRKEYVLDIEENSEDELNSLKNSLYKITVLLKEEAENKKIQNESILTTVSDISHQLKTFLTCMQIMLDNILESKHMDEDTKKKFIIEASRQIKGVNFLLLSLLKLSKLEASVIQFEKTTINIKQMVDEIITNMEVLIEVKQISIKQNINNDINISGDYNWNKEAIQNIIKNAIEHTEEGKSITITAETNDVYTCIRIIDEGQGISQKDLKHIFERFYKANGSKSDSIGIGLALSKSIIERQNGYIEVDSKLGEGTTFTIKYLKIYNK